MIRYFLAITTIVSLLLPTTVLANTLNCPTPAKLNSFQGKATPTITIDGESWHLVGRKTWPSVKTFCKRLAIRQNNQKYMGCFYVKAKTSWRSSMPCHNPDEDAVIRSSTPLMYAQKTDISTSSCNSKCQCEIEGGAWVDGSCIPNS